ncbi:hypothetical protein HJG60_011806 [Phyllostomus discolor]|uniref:Uncharacterized protein n=1 Tax=Phyllostomus discolor TaxID=89673 RepID=A0A833ZPF7_9CHIR|nr:hypothetical protein HJG60_011806 [Phyllostomus discolor]
MHQAFLEGLSCKNPGWLLAAFLKASREMVDGGVRSPDSDPGDLTAPSSLPSSGPPGIGPRSSSAHSVPFILRGSPPLLLLNEPLYTRLCGKDFPASFLIFSTNLACGLYSAFFFFFYRRRNVAQISW